MLSRSVAAGPALDSPACHCIDGLSFLPLSLAASVPAHHYSTDQMGELCVRSHSNNISNETRTNTEDICRLAKLFVCGENSYLWRIACSLCQKEN